MEEWINEWINKRMSEWMNGWMNKRMNLFTLENAIPFYKYRIH